MRYHDAGISPIDYPQTCAISSPLILPEKIAAEASAISSASPATKAWNLEIQRFLVKLVNRIKPNRNQESNRTQKIVQCPGWV